MRISLMFLLLASAGITLGASRRFLVERLDDLLDALKYNRYKHELLDEDANIPTVNVQSSEYRNNDLRDYVDRHNILSNYDIRKNIIPIHDDLELSDGILDDDDIDEDEDYDGNDKESTNDYNKFLENSKQNNDDCGVQIDEKPNVKQEFITMPHVAPKHRDTYLCVAHMLPKDDRYLVEFTPHADMTIAHHMLLFGCSDDTPEEGKKEWGCGEMRPVCGGGAQSILYAWGKNAPALKMPKNVGFHVGGRSQVRYLVLQIHYLDVSSFKRGHTDVSGISFKMTTEKKCFLAGIYFLGDGSTDIPPHKPKTHIDMACDYPSNSPQIFPFRFRVHAHKLSTVITGYRLRDGKFTLIGRGDPQRPQAFYRVFNDVDIQGGDKLVGRCTYNSTSRNRTTYIGPTHSDEMCNFYIMYFYDSRKYPKENSNDFGCDYANPRNVKYPQDSDTPLAVMEAKKILEVKGDNSYEVVENQYTEVQGWPQELPAVGQISGVDVDDKNDMVVLFHRGNRVWGDSTFNLTTNIIKTRIPIKEHTLMWLSRETGKFIKKGGKNMFLMPHGITIDKQGNIWVTDVGAHQVIKLSPDLELLLTLGEFRVPGNDYRHFCKPTDVAVMQDGSFFVADGYCNSRVIKFHANGQVDKSISKKMTASIFPKIGGFHRPFSMSVVHGLALDEEHRLLYVADRENRRVLVFDPSNGEYVTYLANEGSVYAVAYNENNGGVLHVINGTGGCVKTANQFSSGTTYSLSKHKPVSRWYPAEGFRMPHDLAVTNDNREIFVVEICPPYRVMKFQKKR